jgi:nucleoside-diphosphate-sugar epimerase
MVLGEQMKVWITGIAGVLGSNLAEMLVEKGYKVKGNDIIRKEEAWRLSEVIDKIEYRWKATEDLTKEELEDIDIVFDCGLPVADRPLGTNSPFYSALGNIKAPLQLLEIARRLEEKPILIYPSSFNALYGYSQGTTFTEDLLVNPSTVYGWSKGAVENLYRAYFLSFDVPVIITRVGSAFGPKMRSDELIARLIIFGLKKRKFILKSPQAKRLWCYGKDVLGFYEKLLKKLEEEPQKFIGLTLHVAGNKGDKIVTNVELANIIKEFIPELTWVEGKYEAGEVVNGKPIDFKIDCSFTRNLLGYQPKYSLEEGMKETKEWFEKNLWRYV